MIQLWLGVAALTLLALFFVFLPLYKAREQARTLRVDTREEDNIEVFKDRLKELEAERESGSLSDTEFEVLKLELEKNLLIDVGDSIAESQPKGLSLGAPQYLTIVLLAVLIPVVAIPLYLKVGYPDELAFALNMPADPFEGREPTLDEAIAQLQLELEANPDNPEGWYVLGSTFVNQGRYQEGVEALRRVESLLTPEDVQYSSVKGQLAQAMFFAADGNMTAEVLAQVDATLEIEPFEITALGLKGIDAFERESYREAVEYWQRALLNSDGATADSFRTGITRARDELAARGEDVSNIVIPEVARIPVAVTLDENLAQGIAPDTPVFVIARPVEGGMPLAAVRLTVADLPAQLELSDTDAMSPQARLSSVDQVSVSARVSVSGNVSPQPGDMMVEITPVDTSGLTNTLELRVQEVVQ